MNVFEEYFKRAQGARDPDAAVLLLLLMRELSEEIWAAGWMHGTEAALWEVVCGQTLKWGMAEIEVETAEHLRRLLARAGGWWHWVAHQGETFVSPLEWQSIYEREWLPRREKKRERRTERRAGE